MGKCDEFDRKVILDERSGLVLEGGGMRGVFTCGVLDNFMDRGIRFPYSIGVSAGARQISLHRTEKATTYG